ncbi:flavodoxin family protein [Caulobacter sp. DWR2-3-1b2]|uniref:flavodoxin family protein n=1 Tax=unclassified Caulobacter TaxID=2648921 RepID=UPI003CFB8B34
MSKVAIVYRSGYGHTAVLAERVAEGVRDAGQTPVLLKIENAAQDFAPLIDKISQADAVVFGAPTYMGDVSGVFKVFADATAARDHPAGRRPRDRPPAGRPRRRSGRALDARRPAGAERSRLADTTVHPS